MSLFLALSILLRLAAMVWSIILLWRLRDWRMGFLTALLGLMALHQSLIFWPRGPIWPLSIANQVAELPGLAISILALLALIFLERVLYERRRMEATLAEERNLLRTVIDNLPDYIYAKDKAGRFILSNVANARVMGASRPDEVIGKTDFDFYPQELAMGYYQIEQTVIQSGQSLINQEEPIINPAGKQQWILTTQVPLKDWQSQVVGLVGVGRDITEQKRAEALWSGQKRILEMIATGVSLEKVLEALVYFVEEQVGGVLASILLLDDDGMTLRHGSAPSLPDSYNWAIDGLKIGPTVGSCGTAIFRREQVIVSDIATDPLWENYRDLALRHGLQACWSTPIFSTGGEALGTFAMYYAQPCSPTPYDLQLINVASHIAGIAIERQQDEKALRLSEERFRQVISSISDHIYVTEMSPDGNYINRYLSPNLETLTGYPLETFTSNWGFWPSEVIHPEDQDIAAEQMARLAYGQDSEVVYRMVRADGKIIWVRDSARIETVGLRKIIYGVISDITGHMELEEQLRQAQKMEAIGRLAGGIAHDFNNLLTIISGYSEVLLHRYLDNGHSPRKEIEQIHLAAEKATSLTRQLLAFSRRQALQPKVLNLNNVLDDLGSMLRRLLGEDIRLHIAQGVGLGYTKTDPGQIEQVIMNLVINARDAMPQGGALTIETANVELDAEYARRHMGVTPGPYVLLAVSDTGQGIDAETLGHIFEPFFTTKETGKGTGLGLATVHGIVNQSGGHIWVYSEPGVGSTFKVYLPCIEERLNQATPAGTARDELPKGTETVLLVEDETSVRELVRKYLEEMGYTVLEADDAGHAVQICKQYSQPIDLLVTDVVMPQMNGRQLKEAVARLRPQIKVLYMSGYADQAVIHQAELDTDSLFLQKPFTARVLAHKVRQLLNGQTRLLT